MIAAKYKRAFRYSSILLLLAISLSAGSQELKDMKYFGRDYFLLEGTEIADSLKENPYDRLPLSYKETVRKPLWDLSKNSAGLSIRFRSNSGCISVKWTLLNNLRMNHMAETGIKGIDLYFNNNGKWQYLNTARPVDFENEFMLIKNMPAAMREYKMYLPLYDGIESIEVGIDSNSVIEKPAANNGRSIIFYGTSITQGGCASRPGMAHTNIISRKLNIDCINFGFSGNGRMEQPISELISGFDPLFYVIECLPNMTREQVIERTFPLVKTIRGKHPETPILLVENFIYESMVLDSAENSRMSDKNAALKKEFDKMTEAGFSNIFYIESEHATGDDHEGTVDGVHFTDLGFLRYAEFLTDKFIHFGLIPYNIFLTGVPDIRSETVVGVLPRLPRRVKGVYGTNTDSAEVKVIWPSPADNSQVLSPGTYTVTGRIAGSDIEPKATVTVRVGDLPETPNRTLEPFDLDQVTLNPDIYGRKTKFIENRDKFLTGLAATNPDNFLYMFRNAFGQEQPEGAEEMGVWDSQETKVRGHATGHYLSALAQAYAGSGYDAGLQAKFAEKMEYMVNTLYELSQMSGQPQTAGGEHVSDPAAVPPSAGKAGYDSDLSVEGIRTDYWNWGKGFISAYPPDQFVMLEKGATYGGSDAQVWAPYYTLHKIMAGLMDVYELSGNGKALEIVKGMADWVYARLSRVPQETLLSMWNRYIAGEYGGMNEALARLSRITGESRYMKAAQLFDNIRLFYGDANRSHGLAKNVDMFRGLHANQHIPQIIGALELYRDTRIPEYYHIADNFWHIATGDYMYSIGGVAGARNPDNPECFTAQPSTLYENGFAEGGQNETCATYNMLKLTRNLFLFDPRTEYMDYYERGLYNHILASVAEHTPANTYHVPLRPGSVKQFDNPDMNGFTCCNGTGLESSTKLQNTIYFRSADNRALYVNLYVPSTLTWDERNLTVTQTTAFPKEERTLLTINGKGRFDLTVRVPHWATKGFFVKINGRDVEVDAVPGSYLTLSRRWKNGDTVELRMPFSFWLDPVMDQHNIASLFYGPVLLAAQEPAPLTWWRKVTLNAQDIGKSVTGDPSKLEFMIDGVVYKPFFDSYGRYSVYLDVEFK